MTRIQKIAETAGHGSWAQYEGLTWAERYNNYTVVIRGWLTLSVEWGSDGQGYKAKVAGRPLKTRSKDLHLMMSLAVRTTKAWLANAQEELTQAAEKNNFEKSVKNTGQGGANTL